MLGRISMDSFALEETLELYRSSILSKCMV